MRAHRTGSCTRLTWKASVEHDLSQATRPAKRCPGLPAARSLRCPNQRVSSQDRVGVRVMEIERNVGDGAAMGDAVHVDAGNDEGGCVSRRATRFQALLDRALTESFAPEPVVVAKEGDDTLGDSTLLRNLTTHMLRAVHDNVKCEIEHIVTSCSLPSKLQKLDRLEEVQPVRMDGRRVSAPLPESVASLVTSARINVKSNAVAELRTQVEAIETSNADLRRRVTERINDRNATLAVFREAARS
ncbi:Nnf1 [Plasmodiophora brassicae]